MAPVYLDYAATTPLRRQVLDEMLPFMTDAFGNAGSRTHSFGADANRAVEAARSQVAAVVAADPDEVIFTPGATTANNLALRGLAKHAEEKGHTHILSTQIEHKAVLEPLEYLANNGFDVELCPVGKSGRLDPDEVARRLRPETALVSMMAANNETGIVQPVSDVCELLATHDCYFHVDAAQTFGKLSGPLRTRRIDLISASAHKLHGPKGIGCLIARKRRWDPPPLTPIVSGGGQESGLWPGTQPVHQIVGFGAASRSASEQEPVFGEACRALRTKLLDGLRRELPVEVLGDEAHALPHVVALHIAGVDAEALMLATKKYVAISNGSACTSTSYEPSHVLSAMGFAESTVECTTRWSWGAESEIEHDVLHRVAEAAKSLHR